MTTMHVIIKGKVQGVFYRATAKEVAQNLKISGWIKNTDEGHVEAVISGSEDKLQQFIVWCKQGPSGAIITHVHAEEISEQSFERFSILK